jgi:DNA-binding HxlR family transcriptional regulator
MYLDDQMIDRSYDVLNPNCPSRRLMAMLSDKWVVLILIALGKRGTLRNGELKRTLRDISQKMLIQTLKQLEEYGLVSRTSYNTVPPHVEYSLTELGHSLLIPVKAICAWAEMHAEEIEAGHAARYPATGS